MRDYKFEKKEDFYLIRGKNGFAGLMEKIDEILSDGTETVSSKKRRSSKKRDSMSIFYSNSVIFICGGIYLGTKSEEYYSEMFSRLDAIGDRLDIDFIIVRANGDNPSWFNGEKIHTKHVIAVEDYSTVTIKNHKALCVGGAVSCDRSWRKKHQPESYFEGETPIKSDEMTDLSDVDTIISCTIPSFVNSRDNLNGTWAENDDKLNADTLLERNVMDNIYVKLTDGKSRLWGYTKYTQGSTSKYNNITFVTAGKLNISRVTPVTISPADISSFSRYASTITSDTIINELGNHNERVHQIVLDEPIMPYGRL